MQCRPQFHQLSKIIIQFLSCWKYNVADCIWITINPTEVLTMNQCKWFARLKLPSGSPHQIISWISFGCANCM